jgi:hypothetical protein
MPIRINAKPALAVNSFVRTTKRFIQERPKVLYSSEFRAPCPPQAETFLISLIKVAFSAKVQPVKVYRYLYT